MSQTELSNVDLYLQRLGFDSPPPPTLESLRELQSRHTCVFPFETLSTMLRLPVPIDLASVERKILYAGRGGYCYELNNMFLALLLHLGFEARGITGRVVMGGPEDALVARTHRLCLVTVSGVRYIADVGFGGMVPTAPLRLDTEEEQPTGHEPYRIVHQDSSYILRAKVAGEWRPMYVFDLQMQSDIDYQIGNWYVCTHPQSPFMGQLMVARTGEGLRRTLNNGSYAVHRTGLESVRRQITAVDELIELLEREFEIRVPHHPEFRQVVGQVIAPQPML
ncbi:arylamine N-acetyltransferase [Pseudomonas purpurea]|uniref:arylamine N-acetyltransferase family protein n=1 Tax=Pseudomonas purpurea TaxID=3136737 RepID=UPI0032635F7B